VNDSVCKSYTCNEADPHVWGDIRMSGRALLESRDLDWYRDLVPDNEDLQYEWDAVMGDPLKCITLLIGQKDDEEQRMKSDEENYHPPFEAEQRTQNFFLAYHEIKAHLKWFLSRPAESAAYKRFQVSQRLGSPSFPESLLLTRLLCRCGTVSRWRRAMPWDILWGMIYMGALSRLESWGMMMMVMKTMTAAVTVGRPARWTRFEKGFLCTAVSQRFSWAITEWGTCNSNLIAYNEISF
jgi:hypothetical protein